MSGFDPGAAARALAGQIQKGFGAQRSGGGPMAGMRPALPPTAMPKPVMPTNGAGLGMMPPGAGGAGGVMGPGAMQNNTSMAPPSPPPMPAAPPAAPPPMPAAPAMPQPAAPPVPGAMAGLGMGGGTAAGPGGTAMPGKLPGMD